MLPGVIGDFVARGKGAEKRLPGFLMSAAAVGGRKVGGWSERIIGFGGDQKSYGIHHEERIV